MLKRPNLPDLSKTGLKCNLQKGQKWQNHFIFGQQFQKGKKWQP